MEFKVIFGLGNPGEEYERTYHNVGSMFAEYLTKSGKKFKIIDMPVNKLNPVYMNESGRAVKAHVKKSGYAPKDILIVHDESDLPLGHFKYSYDASSAGHKGVQSIIDELGTKSFWRLRIGIRKKPGKALAFVLKKINSADMAVLEKVFDEAERKMTDLKEPN